MPACVRLAPPAKPATAVATLPRRSARGAQAAAAEPFSRITVSAIAYIRRETFYIPSLGGWLCVFEEAATAPLTAGTSLFAGGFVLPPPFDSSLLMGESIVLLLVTEAGAPADFRVEAYRALFQSEYVSPALDDPLPATSAASAAAADTADAAAADEADDDDAARDSSSSDGEVAAMEEEEDKEDSSSSSSSFGDSSDDESSSSFNCGDASSAALSSGDDIVEEE